MVINSVIYYGHEKIKLTSLQKDVKLYFMSKVFTLWNCMDQVTHSLSLFTSVINSLYLVF